VDLHDVGVRQPGHRLGLADQPPVAAGARRGDLGVDQLERDAAVQPRVVGGVHDPHPARAERLEQHEPVDPRRLDRHPEHRRAQVGHARPSAEVERRRRRNIGRGQQRRT
jgi:hypothetical protein